VTTSARHLARAGLIVTGAYLLGRLLGFVRTTVIVSSFLPADRDAYYAAFRIPDTIFQLVAAGALSTALIPVLAGLFAHGEEARAWRVVATVTNLMMSALLVLAAVLFFLAPQIMPAITQKFGAAQMATTIHLSQVMVLSPIFLALGSVASSVLNALGRFSASSVAPLLYNAAIIAAALFLGPRMGVDALAWGVVAGSILHVGVQVPQLVRQRGFVYRMGVRLTDPAAREAFLLLLPRALGLGVTQITFFVNTYLATGLGQGPLTQYNVAFTALQIPLGVIGVPIGIVLLPSLSRSLATGATADFARLVVRSLRLILYVMLFLTATGIALREPAVTLLFRYGDFTAADAAATAATLAIFLLGLGGHATIVVLARAFYAGKDTRTPVMAAMLSVLVNVVVSVATVGSLGLQGLALGIAAGAWFESSLLLVLLARRTPALELRSLLRAGGEFGLGAVLAGLAAALVLGAGSSLLGPVGRLGLLVEAAVAFAVGGLVFAAYGWLLRIPELTGSLALLRSALRRGDVEALV
jgi:putative peptidoglycan lipid II flippase